MWTEQNTLLELNQNLAMTKCSYFYKQQNSGYLKDRYTMKSYSSREKEKEKGDRATSGGIVDKNVSANVRETGF